MKKISTIVAALAAVFVVSQASALSPPQTFSMQTSTDVTNNFTSWQATRASAAPPSASPNGGNAMKVTRSSGTVFSAGTYSTLFTGWLPTYSCAEVYVRAGSASSVGKTSKLFIRERTAGGTLVGQNSTSIVLSNSWQLVGAQRTVTGGNNLDFYIDLTDSTAGSYFWVDGLYVDGSLVPFPPPGC
jgi:hypothetical protein